MQSKIHSLPNLAAARATCQPAAAARRSQARRGAHPPQDAGVHLRPRLRPAHGRLPTRVRGRRAVVEDLGVRPPDGGQAAADDARPRPPEHACPSGGARRARRSLAPRARSARPSAATRCAPSPPPPRARGRVAPHCSPGRSPPPGRPRGPRHCSAASTGPTRCRCTCSRTPG